MYNRLYELFNVVENDILTFENLGSVFVAGDVNAKVGNKPECVLYDTLIETINTNDYNPGGDLCSNYRAEAHEVT